MPCRTSDRSRGMIRYVVRYSDVLNVSRIDRHTVTSYGFGLLGFRLLPLLSGDRASYDAKNRVWTSSNNYRKRMSTATIK